MPQPIYAFAITAPLEGSEVEVVRWGETQVSSTGLLVEVEGPNSLAIFEAGESQSEGQMCEPRIAAVIHLDRVQIPRESEVGSCVSQFPADG